MTLTFLLGSAPALFAQSCLAQETIHARIGQTALTLTRDMHPSINTDRVTGDVAITMLLNTRLLGVAFPPANGRVRDTVFVVLRTGAVYNSTLGMYGWAIRGRPLRKFGEYSVYKIDQTDIEEVYVGSSSSHPPAFECDAEFRGILTGMVRACFVREFLVAPPSPLLLKSSVVVSYGLSFGELSVLRALDDRVRAILQTAADVRGP